MVLKFYIIFSSILLSSNEKTQNYKVLDLIEVYNLHIKLSSSDIVFKGFLFFEIWVSSRDKIVSRVMRLKF